MGAWGSGLYSNDDAADFLDLVRPVLKLPQPIDELVDILKAEGELEDETTFWLVLADQLEKKGVRHPATTAKAIEILETGTDIEEMRNAEADDSDLKARAKANLKLLVRLKTPRAEKPRKTLKKPQPAAVAVGDYVCFPTQNGNARNPYFSTDKGDFVQNGWGLVQVYDVGWEFGYLNWVNLLPLKWREKRQPTLDDAKQASPYSELGYGTLTPLHFKRMQMQNIGNESPRVDIPTPIRTSRSARFVALNDITICNFLCGYW